MVFADLIVGTKSEGIHVFVVQIRDDDGKLMPGTLTLLLFLPPLFFVRVARSEGSWRADQGSVSG